MAIYVINVGNPFPLLVVATTTETKLENMKKEIAFALTLIAAQPAADSKDALTTHQTYKSVVNCQANDVALFELLRQDETTKANIIKLRAWIKSVFGGKGDGDKDEDVPEEAFKAVISAWLENAIQSLCKIQSTQTDGTFSLEKCGYHGLLKSKSLGMPILTEFALAIQSVAKPEQTLHAFANDAAKKLQQFLSKDEILQNHYKKHKELYSKSFPTIQDINIVMPTVESLVEAIIAGCAECVPKKEQEQEDQKLKDAIQEFESYFGTWVTKTSGELVVHFQKNTAQSFDKKTLIDKIDKRIRYDNYSKCPHLDSFNNYLKSSFNAHTKDTFTRSELSQVVSSLKFVRPLTLPRITHISDITAWKELFPDSSFYGVMLFGESEITNTTPVINTQPIAASTTYTLPNVNESTLKKGVYIPLVIQIWVEDGEGTFGAIVDTIFNLSLTPSTHTVGSKNIVHYKVDNAAASKQNIKNITSFGVSLNTSVNTLQASGAFGAEVAGTQAVSVVFEQKTTISKSIAQSTSVGSEWNFTISQEKGDSLEIITKYQRDIQLNISGRYNISSSEERDSMSMRANTEKNTNAPKKPKEAIGYTFKIEPIVSSEFYLVINQEVQKCYIKTFCNNEGRVSQPILPAK